MTARRLSAIHGVLSLLILSGCSEALRRSPGPDSSGGPDLQLSSDAGRDLPSSSESGVSLPDAPLPKGFIIVSGLSLDKTAVKRGDTLKGTVTYLNNTDAPVTVVRLAIANRPPGGTHSGGPYRDLAPELTQQTVQPGATVTLTASRVFADSDPYGKWEAYPTWSSGNEVWTDGPSVYYEVGDASVPVDSGTHPKADSGAHPGADTGTNPAGDGGVYTGHAVPRLRGVQVRPCPNGPVVTPAELAVLKTWKANVVRFNWDGLDCPSGISTSGYDQIVQQGLTKIDALLPAFKQNGLVVALSMLSCASGQFQSLANQDRLVNAWKTLATRYKNAPEIWAYDLANEPVEPEPFPSGVQRWNDLAERIAQAIRTVDPSKAISVSVPNWDLSSGFVGFRPIKATNVIYTVHLYEPHEFTLQGVPPFSATNISYPGTIGGQYWDKAKIEAQLAPVISFAKTHHVQIYVGEFGCVRYAPNSSCYNYLKDAIDIFEKYGWDWTLHAFREWDGFSVEHSSNPSDTSPSPTPTDRQKLLTDWFALNQYPY